MRALVVDSRVAEEVIAKRRSLGHDILDEIWDGVWHILPPHTVEHQRVVGDVLFALMTAVEGAGLGLVIHQLNVADPVKGMDDLRIPDVSVVLKTGHALVLEPYIAGGPDFLVEVRSPNDETNEKLPWYAMQGVREALVIDQDTKGLELYRLHGGALVRVASSPGVVESQVVPLRFEQVQRQGKPGLLITHVADLAKRWEI